LTTEAIEATGKIPMIGLGVLGGDRQTETVGAGLGRIQPATSNLRLK